MPDADAILDRFPGPVTLNVSRRGKLAGLVLSLVFAAFMGWLMFDDASRDRYLSGLENWSWGGSRYYSSPGLHFGR